MSLSYVAEQYTLLAAVRAQEPVYITLQKRFLVKHFGIVEHKKIALKRISPLTSLPLASS